MKYLLKIKKKEDTTHNVAIDVSSDLREFGSLKNLIRHLFDNAVFIESYEIFEINEFEKSDELEVNSEGKVNITTPNANATFN